LFATTGPENLIAASAPKVHSVLCAVTNIIAAESLLNTRVVVSHTLAMFRAVLPIVAA
jgi:hypothetical protein